MAIFKCKMCGGDLNVTEEIKVAECEYCGSMQTIPNADDEKKITMFNRANRLRLACEFDKSAGVYETIVSDFPEEAEAYWGLVLCKFGIEYVDDPATGKKIPTCHRSSFESVMDDSDFEQALENADAVSHKVYREEAKAIEELRKGIIEVSSNEQPYDIFICYKETDENGDRTLDSVLAQDIYDAITEKGYRTFFSRITLEDKLGQEYEPYIFAALNSAKIMLAVGTDYEYYNAVWVKNEWSRYLKLMTQDKGKHLIPCFKGIDAYDMPKEFSRLQAQDLGKLGAIQDLLRGIDKILLRDTDVAETAQPSAATAQQISLENCLKRGKMALEDEEWANAERFFEDALNLDAECSEGYFGLAMCDHKVTSLEALVGLHKWDNKHYRRGKQFADSALLDRVETLEQERIAVKKGKEAIWKQYWDVWKQYWDGLQKFNGLITAGGYHTVGLKSDGTVVAVGDNKYGKCEVSDWTDVVAVSAGWMHTFGLKSDGTVVAVGDNEYGQCNVSEWKDIVAVSGGDYHTVGLKSDGTAVAVGANNCGQSEVSEWSDIVSVSAGAAHTVGLKTDGTVVAVGGNKCGQCEVSEWSDIVAVSAGNDHTIGLKSDGTVVAVGDNNCGQCEVSEWSDIVSVVVPGDSTYGLKTDGTVVAVGFNKDGQCNVSEWSDIVSVVARGSHVVGLKSDGTVVAVGENDKGQCNVSGWRLLKQSDNLEEERIAREKREEEERIAREKREEEERIARKKREEEERIAREKYEEEQRINRERRLAGVCRHCGGDFKGLFGKKCSVCGKPKDY